MYERFSDRARKSMQLANHEAQKYHHEYIGPEHILIGIIREGGGVAVTALANLDVKISDIESDVRKYLNPYTGREQAVMGRLPHTPDAKVVIEQSIAAARDMLNNYVGTEHLLIGLLSAPDTVASVILSSHVTRDKFVSEVVRLLNSQSKDVVNDVDKPVIVGVDPADGESKTVVSVESATEYRWEDTFTVTGKIPVPRIDPMFASMVSGLLCDNQVIQTPSRSRQFGVFVVNYPENNDAFRTTAIENAKKIAEATGTLTVIAARKLTDVYPLLEYVGPSPPGIPGMRIESNTVKATDDGKTIEWRIVMKTMTG